MCGLFVLFRLILYFSNIQQQLDSFICNSDFVIAFSVSKIVAQFKSMRQSTRYSVLFDYIKVSPFWLI